MTARSMPVDDREELDGARPGGRADDAPGADELPSARRVHAGIDGAVAPDGAVDPDARRARVARHQAELAGALAGPRIADSCADPEPDCVLASFDTLRVEASRRALLQKRARTLTARFPGWAHTAGSDVTDRFVAWADHHPLTAGGSSADLVAFDRFDRAARSIPTVPAGALLDLAHAHDHVNAGARFHLLRLHADDGTRLLTLRGFGHTWHRVRSPHRHSP